MKKRVLALRKSPSWFCIVRYLAPGAKHFSFTEDPAKATEITDEHMRALSDELRTKGTKFQLAWVQG